MAEITSKVRDSDTHLEDCVEALTLHDTGSSSFDGVSSSITSSDHSAGITPLAATTTQPSLSAFASQLHSLDRPPILDGLKTFNSFIMFGLLIAGRSLTDPSTLRSFSATEHAYTVPASPPFAHLAVFLTPGAPPLPADTAVAVFVRFPPPAHAAAASGDATQPGEFKLLGGLSAQKPSAVFRVHGLGGSSSNTGNAEGAVFGDINGVAEVDMDADDTATVQGQGGMQEDVTIGLLVQPAAQLAPQLAALQQQQQSQQQVLTPYRAPAPAQPGASRLPVKVLAQRIITNAFNYLASFAQRRAGSGGEEMVPLKSLEAWWRKLEARIDADPGFLEREGEEGGA